MTEFVDEILMCVYCGCLLPGMSEDKIKRFGKPECCEFDMLAIDREKIHTIVGAMDNLKENLEEELLKGII